MMDHVTSAPAPGLDDEAHKQSRSAETRQRIIQAAEKLFARRSFASVSMRQITGEAGVALAAAHYLRIPPSTTPFTTTPRISNASSRIFRKSCRNSAPKRSTGACTSRWGRCITPLPASAA